MNSILKRIPFKTANIVPFDVEVVGAGIILTCYHHTGVCQRALILRTHMVNAHTLRPKGH